MKLIAITTPNLWDGESEIINALFDSGLQYLHLRKPDMDILSYEDFIKSINHKYYQRIVLHSHFSLAKKYSLGGVHLNLKNSICPKDWNGKVSRSCHSLDEAMISNKNTDYYFLSPIFDSISKIGYHSSFSIEELIEAKKNGIITQKTIALGGISPQNINLLKSLCFGGVAVLGFLWGNRSNNYDIISRFRFLQDCLIP